MRARDGRHLASYTGRCRPGMLPLQTDAAKALKLLNSAYQAEGLAHTDACRISASSASMTGPQAIQKETTMNHPENSKPQQGQRPDADAKSQTYVPSYRLLMSEPTVLLAGNPTDRSDVATAAILGYN